MSARCRLRRRFLFYAAEGGEALCADFLDGGHIISAAHRELISHISSIISFSSYLLIHIRHRF